MLTANSLAGPNFPQILENGTRVWLLEDAYVRVLQEGLSHPPSGHRTPKCTSTGRNTGHFGGFSEKPHFANSALWGRFSGKTGCRGGLTAAGNPTGHPTLPSRGPLSAETPFWSSKTPFGARRPPKQGRFSDTRPNTRQRKVDFAFLPDPSLLLLSPATRHLPF